MIAVNIATEKWNEVIEWLQNNGWRLTYKYENFDAGIDFDFIRLEKNKEKILMAWDNWFEGEIQCSENQLKMLAEQLSYDFKIGEPENLKPSIIKMYDR
ncbi:hypothetical protein [Fulvivirga ligni]|uniref:hypothetical protein n=1 Tax=Fulvivirga ligni TaxID=2904246 RepID=UPI001F3F0034|nr:hypothetical protein [Fulvivirga ligni]UII21544.1 hypothetical protein LVD16_27325 [Fulvivirga ligni]